MITFLYTSSEYLMYTFTTFYFGKISFRSHKSSSKSVIWLLEQTNRHNWSINCKFSYSAANPGTLTDDGSPLLVGIAAMTFFFVVGSTVFLCLVWICRKQATRVAPTPQRTPRRAFDRPRRRSRTTSGEVESRQWLKGKVFKLQS